MWSSAVGHLEVARFLVESGANVQAIDGWYYNTKTCFLKSHTPLQLGSIFLISVISGHTALMCSSNKGHLDITRFLVESGANLEAKNNEYYTLKHDV